MTAGRAHPPTASFDAVVIGGGIVGMACAAHLAEDGRRVVLFERHGIAAGASGRNSGVVQRPFDPALADLHLETVRLYRALADRVGGAPERAFRLPDAPAGLLLVSLDPAAAKARADQLAVTHPDLDPTYVGPGDLGRLEPTIAAGVAAVRLEIGYPVEPAAATHAYAAWAERLGVEVRIGSTARPWLDGGRARGIITDTGERMAADAVIVAAGPWTPGVIDPTGTWRPIRPIWGVVVATTLPAPPRHVLEEADISTEPGMDGVGRADGDDGATHDAGVEFSLITAGGTSSLGSTFLAGAPDPADLVPAIVERGARFIPAISTARLGAHRRCARPVSLDGRPLIGAVPGSVGLWIAAGHGPWGISTGPATGRLLADLVAGRRSRPPGVFDPARFERPPP